MQRTAILSEDGLHRYVLGRRWGNGDPMVFCMLNPSTADALIDDPTIRRCIGFAKREGYGSIQVVNLFAYRTPKPAELLQVDEDLRRGPENDQYVKAVIFQAGIVVCAWGAWWTTLPERKRTSRIGVESIAHGYHKRVACLGTTKNGSPRHPLYLPEKAPLEPWGPFEGAG